MSDNNEDTGCYEEYFIGLIFIAVALFSFYILDKSFFKVMTISFLLMGGLCVVASLLILIITAVKESRKKGKELAIAVSLGLLAILFVLGSWGLILRSFF
jgi:hypothetical protein